MTQTGEKYIWTSHSQFKMKQYALSESLVKRVIRHPDRVEEAIVEDLVAAMKKTQSKQFPEVWVMYKPIKKDSGKIKVITAWRYPGQSPERDPIPPNILQEIKSIVGV